MIKPPQCIKKKGKKILWIGRILILLFIYQHSVHGKENKILTLNIVTPEWTDVTNKDGTGLYFELLHLVYDPAGIQVKCKFVPWARAVEYIDLKLGDAMLGSYNSVDAFFPKFPLDTEYTAVVYKKGTVGNGKEKELLKIRL